MERATQHACWCCVSVDSTEMRVTLEDTRLTRTPQRRRWHPVKTLREAVESSLPSTYRTALRPRQPPGNLPGTPDKQYPRRRRCRGRGDKSSGAEHLESDDPTNGIRGRGGGHAVDPFRQPPPEAHPSSHPPLASRGVPSASWATLQQRPHAVPLREVGMPMSEHGAGGLAGSASLRRGNG